MENNNWIKHIFVEKIIELIIVVIVGGLALCLVQKLLKDNTNRILLIKTIPNSQVWGLKNEVNKGHVFHDFDFSEKVYEERERATQFLWSDPAGEFESHGVNQENYVDNQFEPINYIWARVLKNEKCLRIGFINQAWGSNIAIRPKDDMPIDISSYQYLLVEVKSPKKQSIGFRVRMVDENNIHWAFGKEHDPSPQKEPRLKYYTKAVGNPLSTNSEEWIKFKIPLDSKDWTHFGYDGPTELEQIKKVRTHKILLANLIIIEVGLVNDTNNSTKNIMSGLDSSKKPGFIDINKIWFE